MAIPGLKLELLEVNHFPEVIDFFHEHYKEPLDAALGISDEDSKKFLEETLVKVVNDHISFLCRTASGELIGVRLADIINPGDSGRKSVQNKDVQASPALRVIDGIVRMFMDFRNANFEPSTYLRGMGLCVHTEYRRKGIARLLVEQSMNAGLRKGCSEVFVTTTSTMSQKFYEAYGGFEEVFKVRYADYKTDSGELAFARLEEGEEYMKMYHKKL